MAFKSLPGDGVVITIAGAKGLENPTQTPLPTAATYQTYCRGGSGSLLGAAPGSQELKKLLRIIGSTSISAPSPTGASAGCARSTGPWRGSASPSAAPSW